MAVEGSKGVGVKLSWGWGVGDWVVAGLRPVRESQLDMC